MYAIAATVVASLAGCCASHARAVADATQPLSRPAVGRVLFENAKAQIRFAYPVSWHPVQDDTVLTLVPAGESKLGNRTLAVDKPDLPLHIPGLIPLGLVENGFVDDLKKRYKQIDSLQSSSVTIDGSAGREIRASGVRDSGPAVIDAAVCVHGDAVYVIDAECDAAYKSEMDAAFDIVTGSIQWMD